MKDLTRQSLVDMFENIILDFEQRQASEIDVEDLNYEELKCISESLQFAQLKAEKSGEWVDVSASEFDDTNRCYRCSVCGKEINGYDIGYYFKFCHGCGAKMKKGGKPMKEEILRAIEFLEDKYLTVSQCIHSDEAKLNNHNVTLAITALQEQLNRLEGCWLCEELLQSEFDFYEQKHSIQMIHGKVRIRFGNKEITSFKANFCPNCGRKMRCG